MYDVTWDGSYIDAALYATGISDEQLMQNLCSSLHSKINETECSDALRNGTPSYKAWLSTFLSSIFKTQLKREYGLLYIVGKIILCSLQIYYFYLSDFIIWRALIGNNNSIFQLKSNFASFQNISEMRFEWI